jgi:hypothetical protein
MRFTTVLSAAMLLATVACEDRNRDLPTAPTRVAPNQISAYLVASNSTPAVGTDITVWVRARRGSAIAPIGSFTLRVSYDSTRLRFKQSGRSTQGMVMANGAKAGVLVAAGASADGFKNDELLAVTFNVKASGALTGLALSVSELNSIAFADQKSAMRVERRVYRSGK